MKRENPNHVRAGEPKPVEAEMRQQGLQVLARMIAQMYLREIQARNEVVPERDKEISPQV